MANLKHRGFQHRLYNLFVSPGRYDLLKFHQFTKEKFDLEHLYKCVSGVRYWPPDDVDDLIAFLLSLKTKEAEQDAADLVRYLFRSTGPEFRFPKKTRDKNRSLIDEVCDVMIAAAKLLEHLREANGAISHLVRKAIRQQLDSLKIEIEQVEEALDDTQQKSLH